jgi:hypothetical protein
LYLSAERLPLNWELQEGFLRDSVKADPSAAGDFWVARDYVQHGNVAEVVGCKEASSTKPAMPVNEYCWPKSNP